jgi:hypothetical protein
MSIEAIENSAMVPTVEEIASEVSTILLRRLNAGKSGADIVKLLQIVLLDSHQTAEFLGVKPKTISTWVSQGKIPVRYVNSEPRFLLSELLLWTLPHNDPHSRYRLSVAASCKIAANQLAAVRKESDDASI